MPPETDAHPLLDLLLAAPLQRGPGHVSLQKQLHARLRGAILEHRLPAHSRLPGSRALAQALGVSRNSVTAVYEQLASEGLMRPSRQGSQVAALGMAAEADSASNQISEATFSQQPVLPPVADRVTGFKDRARGEGGSQSFRPGVPALNRFPLVQWRRCLDRAVQQGGAEALGYGESEGEMALRTAIQQHLAVARGVVTAPQQILITEGAQEALTLCLQLTTNPGDVAWVEDPGYRGAQSAFRAADLQIQPLAVDAQGLCVPDAAQWASRPPRVIYTTPSHQYPLGAVLPAQRRLQLMALAAEHGSWIIEDDYDSEFRHAGEPIGAMQGLSPGAPVLYVGTFSKTLFPSLRMGFLVLPAELHAQGRHLIRERLRGGHRLEQLALADFISSGAFARHLGRMRRLYRARRDALVQALREHLKVPNEVLGADSGMHITLRLPPDLPDRLIAQQTREFGMAPAPLSGFFLNPQAADNGLVLGYGNTSQALYVPLVQRLQQIMEAL